ncbi:MAG TPA: hypothetical protein VHC41_00595 [Mycobacteriales bacterium]|nr:hypothetical protein [Mycobacteriales bacterium]
MSDGLLVFDALDDGEITEIIRPAAIVPEQAARAVLVELALRDARSGGHWHAEPTMWRRYDRPWQGSEPGEARLLGSVQVAYGTPTRYAITIYRVTITAEGQQAGYDVQSLCDEALSYGGLQLDGCPRASLAAPPPRFHPR